MATLPTNAEMTGSGVTEGGFKGKLNDFLTFIRDTMGTNGTVAAVRTALGLGALALKNDVVEADIATAAVTTGKVADLAITQPKIADLAVTTSKIAALAITDAKLGSNSVVTAKIATGAVTEPKIADGAASARVIADGAVGTTKLADGAVTAAKTSGFPITQEFVSSEQTITNGGPLTLTHGLSGRPKLVSLELVCKTAELGYSVDDVALIGAAGTGGDTNLWGPHSVRPTATQVLVRYPGNGITVGRADTGALAGITAANWRLVVRAFA